MITTSDILAMVPAPVQLTLLGIGALYLAKKALDALPLLSSLVLGGTNVRTPLATSPNMHPASPGRLLLCY